MRNDGHPRRPPRVVEHVEPAGPPVALLVDVRAGAQQHVDHVAVLALRRRRAAPSGRRRRTATGCVDPRLQLRDALRARAPRPPRRWPRWRPSTRRRRACSSPIRRAGALRHAERADLRRIGGGAFLQVVADVPDRAVVGRIDRGRRVVLPAQRVRLATPHLRRGPSRAWSARRADRSGCGRRTAGRRNAACRRTNSRSRCCRSDRSPGSPSSGRTRRARRCPAGAGSPSAPCRSGTRTSGRRRRPRRC